MSYFHNIRTAISTSFTGLTLSLGHLLQVRKKRKQDVSEPDFFSLDEGTATLQFPHETIPVPDNGRYKLHNEIDDCIVCDKCAKVCPVNCIEIIPIRSAESFGETSDGTPKRIYAEKFDIDMAKCMFCGLCTTVCPTECLTMTEHYDYSTFDIRDHIFPFEDLTPEEAKKRKNEWDEFQAQKASAAKTVSTKSAQPAKPAAKPTSSGKPVFKPKTKPASSDNADKPKAKFKPRIMPKKPKKDD